MLALNRIIMKKYTLLLFAAFMTTIGSWAQLTDCYAAANWTINTSGTSGSVTISETSIDMVGDGDFEGTGLDFIDCANTNGTVSACLTIPATGDFTFDWASGNFLTNPLIDRFGYCLNGVATQLNSLDGGPFGTNSGTETISVTAGDELCFVYASLFADASAPATINNFILTACPPPSVNGLVDCYAPANWTSNTSGTSGSVTISETSIDMVGDGDFEGTGLDFIDCANTNGTVSACLTIPATGDFTFDWASGNFLTNPLIDRFGYCLNGVATQLNSLDGGPFGTNSGTETIAVTAGDELCFVYASLFADASAPATINNFVLTACPAACMAPTDLAVVEDNFGSPNPTVNGTWTNSEGTSECEVRGGRISSATTGTANPVFANITNTKVIANTDGSTLNFNVILYNNPNINFVSGQTYGFEVRCQCSNGSGFSDWSGITPESTFVVPTPPAGRTNPMGELKFDAAGISNLSLFPNPAQDVLNIQIGLQSEGSVNIQLANSLGQIVLQERLNGTDMRSIMNVSSLTSGLYFLNILTENGHITERVIIQ